MFTGQDMPRAGQDLQTAPRLSGQGLTSHTQSPFLFLEHEKMGDVSKQITVLKDCEMALKVHRPDQHETITGRLGNTVILQCGGLLKGHLQHL